MTKKQFYLAVEAIPQATPQQRQALRNIFKRYTHKDFPLLEKPFYDNLLGCIMINVGSMWLGIENDGYTHS